jgi:hypothetical protein
MSAAYLEEAAETLHAIGDSRVLYRESAGFDPTNRMQASMAVLLARKRRRMLCRSTVVHAAFAAEAYVNEFLAVQMADRPERFAEVDWWSPAKKYLEGTAESYGEPLFFEDREAMPVLRDLFDLRNKLAHPRPGFGMPTFMEQDDEDEAKFAPPKLAEFVVMVAGAGDLLVPRAYGFHEVDVIATSLWRGRDVVRAYAQRAANLPAPGQPPEPALVQQALRHVSSMPSLVNPELSTNRIAAARARRGASSAPESLE